MCVVNILYKIYFLDILILLCYSMHGGVIMSDFQKFLDENLGNVRMNDAESVDVPDDYDIFREIRDMIVALRHESHMTQKELAAKCGITQANISNLEKGTSKPTIDSLKKIADALGMRLVVEFVGREVE